MFELQVLPLEKKKNTWILLIRLQVQFCSITVPMYFNFFIVKSRHQRLFCADFVCKENCSALSELFVCVPFACTSASLNFQSHCVSDAFPFWFLGETNSRNCFMPWNFNYVLFIHSTDAR